MLNFSGLPLCFSRQLPGPPKSMHPHCAPQEADGRARWLQWKVCGKLLHDRLGVRNRDIAKTRSKFQPAVFSCILGQGWDVLLHVEAMWLWWDWLGNIFLTDNACLPKSFYLERKTIFWHSDLEGLPGSEGKSALWHPVSPQVLWHKWQGDISGQGALRKDWLLQEVTQSRALPFDAFSISSHWSNNTHLLLGLN